MLKVKQIRKNLNTTYLSDIAFTPTVAYNQGYDTGDSQAAVFTDFAITPSSGSFVANQPYYFRFNAKRSENTDRDTRYGNADSVQFSLILFKNDGGEGIGRHDGEKTLTIAKNLILDPYQGDIGYNDPWKSFSVVFTPNDSGYTHLCFKISRIGYDYVYEKNSEDGKNGPRFPFVYTTAGASTNTLDFTDGGDLAIINNILSLPNGIQADKIGIQSNPGTLFVVNREPIILGRSGIYEINNGTRISTIGVVAPNGSNVANIQDFILDYAYDE